MNKRDIEKTSQIIEGIPVLGVMKNYSADKAGIMRGDIIIEVNGKRTKTIDDYFPAIKLDGAERLIKVWRNGKEIDIRIKLRGKIEEEEAIKIIKESGFDEFLLEESEEELLN